MATANSGQIRQRQPSRWGRNLALLAAVAAILLIGWFWTRMRAASLENAAYVAQTGCLCRHAAGRGWAQCQADPGIKRDWVGMSEDAAMRSVTASVPALASQTARWSKDSGCVLERWGD